MRRPLLLWLLLHLRVRIERLLLLLGWHLSLHHWLLRVVAHCILHHDWLLRHHLIHYGLLLHGHHSWLLHWLLHRLLHHPHLRLHHAHLRLHHHWLLHHHRLLHHHWLWLHHHWLSEPHLHTHDLLNGRIMYLSSSSGDISVGGARLGFCWCPNAFKMNLSGLLALKLDGEPVINAAVCAQG